MKKFLLLVIASSCIYMQAQTQEQRNEITRNYDQSKLQELKTQFQADYEKQQLKIEQYLQTHPDAKRTFTKDGSFYSIFKIDENGKPLYINTKNRASGTAIKANSLYSGGSLGVNISGQGMVAGIWDGGQVLSTHELLTGKVTMQPGQTLNSTAGNNHMTHVSGTMVGKEIAGAAVGSNAYQARGIAYNATSKNYDWNNDIAEMTDFAVAFGYLISNHSYGYTNSTSQDQWLFGAYDDTAVAWDQLVNMTYVYLPFVAVGNEQDSNGSGKTGADQGYDVITGSSAAKNVITVGAVNGDETMSSYSNWGPTDDGRIKPDLVAKGTGINSSYATGDTDYSGNGDDSSGTSYASPAAAAAGLLLQQYYHSLKGSYMKAATLKAVMVAGAKDLGTPGPDYKFGWGLIDVEASANIIKNNANNGGTRIIEYTTNPSLGNETYLVENTTNFPTLDSRKFAGGKATLTVAWTDDAGTVQTAADGVDPTASRLVYKFGVALRQQSPFIQNCQWQLGGMANRTAAAVLASGSDDPVVDNVVQTVIPNTTTDGILQAWVRKQEGSPEAVKPFSVVITGLKSTLAVDDIEAKENNITIFPNPTTDFINVISNTEYKTFQIYNVEGQLIKNGTMNDTKVNVSDLQKGNYLITFDNDFKTSNKFIVNP